MTNLFYVYSLADGKTSEDFHAETSDLVRAAFDVVAASERVERMSAVPTFTALSLCAASTSAVLALRRPRASRQSRLSRFRRAGGLAGSLAIEHEEVFMLGSGTMPATLQKLARIAEICPVPSDCTSFGRSVAAPGFGHSESH